MNVENVVNTVTIVGSIVITIIGQMIKSLPL